MNLFVTNESPRIAATHLDDKRIGSALREACQMMSVAIKHHSTEIDEFYHCGEGLLTRGMAYVNHPVTQWVRANRTCFEWTLEYAFALRDEYVVRYGKTHGAGPRVDAIAAFRTCLPAGPLLPFQNSARNEGRGLDFSHMPVPLSYQRYLNERWETDVRPVTFTNRGAPLWKWLTE